MPRAHYNEQLAAMVQTAVDGTVDLARNVLTTCSTSRENCSHMKENFGIVTKGRFSPGQNVR